MEYREVGGGWFVKEERAGTTWVKEIDNRVVGIHDINEESLFLYDGTKAEFIKDEDPTPKLLFDQNIFNKQGRESPPYQLKRKTIKEGLNKYLSKSDIEMIIERIEYTF